MKTKQLFLFTFLFLTHLTFADNWLVCYNNQAEVDWIACHGEKVTATIKLNVGSTGNGHDVKYQMYTEQVPTNISNPPTLSSDKSSFFIGSETKSTYGDITTYGPQDDINIEFSVDLPKYNGQETLSWWLYYC